MGWIQRRAGRSIRCEFVGREGKRMEWIVEEIGGI